MKTRLVFMAAMISIAISGLFASCEKDKNDSPSYSKEQIVGKWDAEKIESEGQTIPLSQYGEIYMIFRSDNTLSMYSYDLGEELNGTWSISGNSINLTVAGQTETVSIKSLTPNTLVLITKSQRRYDDGHIEEVEAYMYFNRDETYQE